VECAVAELIAVKRFTVIIWSWKPECPSALKGLENTAGGNAPGIREARVFPKTLKGWETSGWSAQSRNRSR